MRTRACGQGVCRPSPGQGSNRCLPGRIRRYRADFDLDLVADDRR
jgi:hypothetical protein